MDASSLFVVRSRYYDGGLTTEWPSVLLLRRPPPLCRRLIYVPNLVVPACIIDVFFASIIAARHNGFTLTLLAQRDKVDFIGLQYYGSTLISGGSSVCMPQPTTGQQQ